MGTFSEVLIFFGLFVLLLLHLLLYLTKVTDIHLERFNFGFR